MSGGYKRKRSGGGSFKRQKTGRTSMRKFYSQKNQTKILKQIARREINRKCETKQSNYTSTDGVEILHNNFVVLDNTVLFTTPGPFDPTLNNADNRIGDEVTLRGVKIKGMLELNERYSDVTCRILVVKSAKGDTPTRATLFNGISGNKMLDTLNVERYTILANKFIRLKAPNSGTEGGFAAVGMGVNTQTDGQMRLSRATRMFKLWIPGKKFSKSGVIKYEQGSSQPKFFDYHVVCYAYSNWSTLQDIWQVARVNDYIKTMYYKDA